MIKSPKILIILAIVVLTVLSFNFGFYIGEKQSKIIEKEVVRVLDPESKLVEMRSFNITGILTQIDVLNRTLTLEAEGETIKIKIKEDSPVRSYNISAATLEELLKQGKEPPIEIEFKDIQIGDKVSTFIREEKDKSFIGMNVYVHFPKND